VFVLLLLFCSGATALTDEGVWSKYLSLMFGSTVQAQTVVRAVFLGGRALGNRIFGARADRSSKPLAVCGGIERLYLGRILERELPRTDATKP